MQLHIRGNTNYVLEATNFVELKAKVAEIEGSEDVLLYIGGKPVDYEMSISSIEAHIDVTVPLKGGKVRPINFTIFFNNEKEKSWIWKYQ